MHQPMATRRREDVRAALGPSQAPATDDQITQAAHAIRQIRDPHGPTGRAYEHCKALLAALAPALIARILELEDDKD